MSLLALCISITCALTVKYVVKTLVTCKYHIVYSDADISQVRCARPACFSPTLSTAEQPLRCSRSLFGRIRCHSTCKDHFSCTPKACTEMWPPFGRLIRLLYVSLLMLCVPICHACALSKPLHNVCSDIDGAQIRLARSICSLPGICVFAAFVSRRLTLSATVAWMI